MKPQKTKMTNKASEIDLNNTTWYSHPNSKHHTKDFNQTQTRLVLRKLVFLSSNIITQIPLK